MNKPSWIVVEEDSVEPVGDICGKAYDLISASSSPGAGLSLATIIVEKGKGSNRHYHKITEEIYYVIEGDGCVILNGVSSPVRAGSCVYIPTGVIHEVRAGRAADLKLISADCPAYDEADVFMC
jgi:mannose-6-phosphate isomerase-like protein (cupin superfamily)